MKLLTLSHVLGLFVPAICAVVPDINQMTRVSQAFFDCCESGKGWAGCSQFVTDEHAPFSIEAVDALPGPPVSEAKSVKDYLDWMEGVVKEFGSKASYEVKAHSFDQTATTAIYYAVFMGYSDYVYMIDICPTAMKVRSLRKVWNDQYAFDQIPGAGQQFELAAKTPPSDVQASDVEKMARISQGLFDCCESGKGWAGCSQFITDEHAPFSVEAVDVLPGPPVTEAKTVKDYLDWMAGVVGEFGAKASYEVKAHGFDQTTLTAMYYGVFMGYSDYVYTIEICPKEMKVRAMRKVWNDQYAFDHIPGAGKQVELAKSISQISDWSISSLVAVALLVSAAAISLAMFTHHQRSIRQPSLLLG